MELGMWGAIELDRDVVAGARVVNVDHEAVGWGCVLPGPRVVDVGCKAVGGGDVVVSARGVDLGSGANDEGDTGIEEGCTVDDNHDTVDEG